MNIFYLTVCLIVGCIQEAVTIQPYGTAVLMNNSNTFNTSSGLKLLINKCPRVESGLTQTQLISRLTASCRYDRLERPYVVKNGIITNAPVKIYIRVYINNFKRLETSDLQFKMHGVIQLRFNDPRLEFKKYASNGKQTIIGSSSLHDLLWGPHILLANSNILDTEEKNLLTAINPDGTVIILSFVQATLYCELKVRKFPFNEVFCPTTLENWMYKSSEVLMHWEQHKPIAFDSKIYFNNYALQSDWTNETINNFNLDNSNYGVFSGNYSSLSFTVRLSREVRYYVMNYFLSSIMIVAISWVSFWLQADQTPARTTLGCTTLLSFITLASSQEDNFPKLTYIKISEVWFFVCTCFIFGSLVEFALVNVIWRQQSNVKIKKIKSKYVLKSALTPNIKRREIMNTNDSYPFPNNFCEQYRSNGDSSIFLTINNKPKTNSKANESIPCPSTALGDESGKGEMYSIKNSYVTMTPKEISLWIDRKARFIFPLSFLIFNAIFWALVYCT